MKIETYCSIKKDEFWISLLPIVNFSVRKQLEWGVGYEKNFYIRKFSLTLCWICFGLFIDYKQKL